jgi:hypothetical protein
MEIFSFSSNMHARNIPTPGRSLLFNFIRESNFRKQEWFGKAYAASQKDDRRELRKGEGMNQEL